jgi:hypothetical protein
MGGGTATGKRQSRQAPAGEFRNPAGAARSPGVHHRDGDTGSVRRDGIWGHHTICTKSYGNRDLVVTLSARHDVREGVGRKIPIICNLGLIGCAADRSYNHLISSILRLSVRFCTDRVVTPKAGCCRSAGSPRLGGLTCYGGVVAAPHASEAGALRGWVLQWECHGVIAHGTAGALS